MEDNENVGRDVGHCNLFLFSPGAEYKRRLLKHFGTTHWQNLLHCDPVRFSLELRPGCTLLLL